MRLAKQLRAKLLIAMKHHFTNGFGIGLYCH
jgi:hypothetical protein